MLSEPLSFNLKLTTKQYSRVVLLHLIVVPQLSSGWWHNYSTKTRLASSANEQSLYSLMHLFCLEYLPWLLGHCSNKQEQSFLLLHRPRGQGNKCCSHFCLIAIASNFAHVNWTLVSCKIFHPWGKYVLAKFFGV
jgi:hypothetical protein